MNLIHLKYAVEVAESGSIHKAADNLLVAPSNLSRTIKELENDLGITIFERTSKGMVLTAEGVEFIRRAGTVLEQISDIENMYMNSTKAPVRFSASAPRLSYVCEAFRTIIECTKDVPSKLYFKETDSIRALKNLIGCSCDIAIVRVEKRHSKYFYKFTERKGLVSEIISEYRYDAVAGKDSRIAELDTVTYDDLADLSEITFSDPYVPLSDVVIEMETTKCMDHHILVSDSMSAYNILTADPECFMWMCPISERVLDRFGLVQKKCAEHPGSYNDILVRRNNYMFSELDLKFIEEVRKSAAECGIKVK